MVKSLMEMCLNLLNKPCKAVNVDKHWLNCGLRCIPFKSVQNVQSEEFFQSLHLSKKTF